MVFVWIDSLLKLHNSNLVHDGLINQTPYYVSIHNSVLHKFTCICIQLHNLSIDFNGTRIGLQPIVPYSMVIAYAITISLSRIWSPWCWRSNATFPSPSQIFASISLNLKMFKSFSHVIMTMITIPWSIFFTWNEKFALNIWNPLYI